MQSVPRAWMHLKICTRLHEAQRGNRNFSDWKQDDAREWVRREECVWCCQQCLPVGSHFLLRPRAGLQPFRPSRNSPHNLPFIGGQSDAGSWLWCTDACVSVCWRELLSSAIQMAAWMFVAVSVCLLHYQGNAYPSCGFWFMVSACHILTNS